jgi:hypothetical protein
LEPERDARVLPDLGPKAAGGCVVISEEDCSAIRAVVRPFWERIRSKSCVYEIPGFQASLTSLVDQGYALNDISLMFGVSRERVRQWLRKFSLTSIAKETPMRRWDDTRNEFVPCPAREHPHSAMGGRRRAVEENKARRRAARQKRQVILTKQLKEFAATLRRTPTLGEIQDEFGTCWQALVYSFMERTHEQQSVRLRRWFASAGLTVRATGFPGWRDVTS